MRKKLSLSVLAGALAALTSIGAASAGSVVKIDRAKKLQTIDGFGFFGAQDVWWGATDSLVSEAWANQVVNDLGITIWRNEYFPPSVEGDPQDADWTIQRPVARTLKRAADANRVPLKFVLTVWSPPGSLKCDVTNDLPNDDVPWREGTKGGGTLCRRSWDAFVEWLKAGVKQHKDAGIDVYAISIQNEPLFWQPFNSCFYQQNYYAEVLAYVAPRLKAAYPTLKIFGPENMLEMEGGVDSPYFYSTAIAENADAARALDIFAVHGYNDGAVPTETSQAAQLWRGMQSKFAGPAGKPLWMTETSGYADAWSGADGQPGARDLAQSIYAALRYGGLSGWLWWQGSELDGVTPYSLMAGTKQRSKRYYVSKNFYRFIRPGARMVDVTSGDDDVLAVAFEHQKMGSFTVVLINTAATRKSINLVGAHVPRVFTAHRTSETEDCADKGAVLATGITLPPSSVTTLVSGNVFEACAAR